MLRLIYHRQLYAGGFVEAKWPGIVRCQPERLPMPEKTPSLEKQMMAFGVGGLLGGPWEGQGSGMQQVAKILAWREQRPGIEAWIENPEAHLHPSIEVNMLMWLLTHGPWTAITDSELFVLRVMKLVREKEIGVDDVEFYVLLKDDDSHPHPDAVTALESMVLGLPPYLRPRLDVEGEFDTPWLDMFDTRLKELF